ncbi:uncharacterized protein BDW70DRAFT_115044 [Aspergillus foveolatus]|uniref:uncharacterized protein n=1 Tax=Aspergillus foveolatus TaxID=210207 RepID=UPI003CCD6E58
MATRFTSLAALACTREVGSWQLAPAEVAVDGVRINVSASRTEDGVREYDRVWPSLIGQIIRPSAQKFRLESRYLYHIWRLRIHPQGEQSDEMAGFLQADLQVNSHAGEGPVQADRNRGNPCERACSELAGSSQNKLGRTGGFPRLPVAFVIRYRRAWYTVYGTGYSRQSDSVDSATSVDSGGLLNHDGNSSDCSTVELSLPRWLDQ